MSRRPGWFRKTASSDTPWVIVADGFHNDAAMERANMALASFLSERGTPVHLVSYRIDEAAANLARANFYRVSKPANSFFLGKWNLERKAWTVAARVIASSPGARVLVNGGNCLWPDINWVHCVHHAWQHCDGGAPQWFKAKNRIGGLVDRRRELRALCAARLIIANSNRTRADIIEHLGVAPERVHTVYLGAEPAWTPADAERRAAARAWLEKDAARPLVAFVGALGYDNNKGFDVLLAAWRRLCARPEWDADLIVAGGGRGLPRWRRTVADDGLAERVTILGFTPRVADVLAAADLLVSPVRYEAYGVNVQEALCAGVPALVSRSAGIAERYPMELGELLIDDPSDPELLAHKLIRWRAHSDDWKRRVGPLGQTLRAHSMEKMATQIVALAEAAPSRSAGKRSVRIPQWLGGKRHALG
jgi:glycosyltransferase involved in cell wall biosynthesis